MNRLTSTEADRANEQFQSVVDDPDVKEYLNCHITERLDITLIHVFKNHTELMKVAKIALIISHGNADVESGFSTNESLLKENMERSIVAQRVLHDAIRNAGGILKVPITKSMRTSVKHAKSAYKLSLSTDKEASRKLE